LSPFLSILGMAELPVMRVTQDLIPNLPTAKAYL